MYASAGCALAINVRLFRTTTSGPSQAIIGQLVSEAVPAIGYGLQSALW